MFVLGLAQGVGSTFLYGFLGPMVASFPELGLAPGADTTWHVLVLILCAGAGTVAGAPFWGWLTDWKAPRPVFNLCLGLSIAAFAAFGTAPSFAVACAARLVGGLVDGTNLALITFTADVAQRDNSAEVAVPLTLAQFMGNSLGFLVGTYVGTLADPVAQFGWESALLAAHPFLFPCLVVSALYVAGVWAVMQGSVGLRTPAADGAARRGYGHSLREVCPRLGGGRGGGGGGGHGPGFVKKELICNGGEVWGAHKGAAELNLIFPQPSFGSRFSLGGSV